MSAAECFFVDSNLLLYYVDPLESGKRRRAQEWMDQLWSRGDGRLSWQVLHEFYWNAVKKMRLGHRQAREMVEDLATWMPVDTSVGLIQRAWDWMDTARLPYWDALILAAAERSGARYLLSEDFQAGRRFADIRIVNPFDHAPSAFSQ